LATQKRSVRDLSIMDWSHTEFMDETIDDVVGTPAIAVTPPRVVK